MGRNGENGTYEDALTHYLVEVGESGCQCGAPVAPTPTQPCASIFFPGCSLLNFAPSMVQDVYALLEDAGIVNGMSFLCCGKLLAFEPDAANVVAAFEQKMATALVDAGVERIVAACPNCVETLRDVVARLLPDAGIQVMVLPRTLIDAGIHVERGMAEAAVGEGAVVAVHDSCPDRTTGEFSASVRALLPADMLVETRHNRATSFCCGALLRAAGRDDAAIEASQRHGREACEVGAWSLVTYCASCAQQLAQHQGDVPVHHYLELLFGQAMDWKETGTSMTVRFLFEEAHGHRDYAGMGSGGAL